MQRNPAPPFILTLHTFTSSRGTELLPYIHIGPLEIPTFGLLMVVAFATAYYALDGEIKRRKIQLDPYTIVAVVAFAGILGAKIWHIVDTPADRLNADTFKSFGALLSWFRGGFAWFGGFVAGIAALLLLARRYSVRMLTMLDVSSSAAAVGYAVGRIGCLISGDGDYGIPTSLPWGMSFPNGLVPTAERVHPTPIYECIAGLLIGWYLWNKGAKILRGPRPIGEVVAEFFLLSGIARFLVEFIRINPRSIFGMSNAQFFALLSAIFGLALLITVRKRFRAQKGEHRILEHFDRRGDVLQPEYHRATPECPHPERWSMYDSMTAEVEVLEFLRTLITTQKPELVVETGTFMGVSTLWIAEGLKRNGFGKVISCEYDPKVYARAKERIEKSGLREWIDLRNESSLEIKVPGTIDLLFSDSDPPLREQEVRRFLPQMNQYGLILMHDASSHLKTVRDAALKLEQEGLISTVLLPTPRGLVVAQKKDGRK